MPKRQYSKHGLSRRRKRHPVYGAWLSMRNRCKPGYAQFKDYGGRGITVCDRWLLSSEQFIIDMLPTWQPGLLLDRINNDGNYEPLNCR